MKTWKSYDEQIGAMLRKQPGLTTWEICKALRTEFPESVSQVVQKMLRAGTLMQNWDEEGTPHYKLA
jgi:hypothetical protein